MRYAKYLILLLAVLALPAIHSQAQVSIGVQIGPDYGYYHPEPVCAYGYYPYYPFDCAPYGYWGPQWFADGVFIGAGPWYHFYYSHPEFHRGYWGGYGRFRPEPEFRREDRGFRGGNYAFRGEDRGFHGGGREFRGGGGFRGEGGFHGGGEFHGGGRGGHEGRR